MFGGRDEESKEEILGEEDGLSAVLEIVQPGAWALAQANAYTVSSMLSLLVPDSSTRAGMEPLVLHTWPSTEAFPYENWSGVMSRITESAVEVSKHFKPSITSFTPISAPSIRTLPLPSRTWPSEVQTTKGADIVTGMALDDSWKDVEEVGGSGMAPHSTDEITSSSRPTTKVVIHSVHVPIKSKPFRATSIYARKFFASRALESYTSGPISFRDCWVSELIPSNSLASHICTEDTRIRPWALYMGEEFSYARLFDDANGHGQARAVVFCTLELLASQQAKDLPDGGPPLTSTVQAVLLRCQSFIHLLLAAMLLGGTGRCAEGELGELERWISQGLQRSSLSRLCSHACASMQAAVTGLSVAWTSSLYREHFLGVFPELTILSMGASTSFCCTSRSSHNEKDGFTCISPGLGPKVILCPIGQNTPTAPLVRLYSESDTTLGTGTRPSASVAWKERDEVIFTRSGRRGSYPKSFRIRTITRHEVTLTPANADGTLKSSAGDAIGQLDRLHSSREAAFRCCPDEDYSEQEFTFFVEHRTGEEDSLHLYTGEAWVSRSTCIPEDPSWNIEASIGLACRICAAEDASGAFLCAKCRSSTHYNCLEGGFPLERVGTNSRFLCHTCVVAESCKLGSTEIKQCAPLLYSDGPTTKRVGFFTGSDSFDCLATDNEWSADSVGRKLADSLSNTESVTTKRTCVQGMQHPEG